MSLEEIKRFASEPADATPDEQALADILWETNAESLGWLDCFKNARAILAAGWVRNDNLHAPLTAIEVRPKGKR